LFALLNLQGILLPVDHYAMVNSHFPTQMDWRKRQSCLNSSPKTTSTEEAVVIIYVSHAMNWRCRSNHLTLLTVTHHEQASK